MQKQKSTKTLSGQALKDFRASVARLKKVGLVRKNVDARKQAPTRYMRAKVKKLQDVVSGNYTALKVSKTVLAKAKSEQQRVVMGRVLAPAKQPKIQAQIRSGNFIEKVTEKKTARGNVVRTREIDLGRFMSMEEFFYTYEDHPQDLNKLKPSDMSFAFTYYGNKARRVFTDAEDMMDELRTYMIFSGYVHPNNSLKIPDENELWEGFSLFSVESNGDWEKQANEDIAFRKRERRRKYRKYLMKKQPAYYEKMLDRDADKKQAKRARLREQGGEEYERYKANARARAKASRDREKARQGNKPKGRNA